MATTYSSSRALIVGTDVRERDGSMSKYLYICTSTVVAGELNVIVTPAPGRGNQRLVSRLPKYAINT